MQNLKKNQYIYVATLVVVPSSFLFLNSHSAALLSLSCRQLSRTCPADTLLGKELYPLPETLGDVGGNDDNGVQHDPKVSNAGLLIPLQFIIRLLGLDFDDNVVDVLGRQYDPTFVCCLKVVTLIEGLDLPHHIQYSPQNTTCSHEILMWLQRA